MYSFDSVIRFSEVDHHGTLTLPGIINYFQDCSIRHSDSLGVGMDHLKDQKKGWILSSWQIIVERYPRMGENVKICTWPTGFKGLYGTRNFVMEDENGEKIAYANSIWVFMDFGRGRPAKPEEDLVERYECNPPLEMDCAPRKIALPDVFEEAANFRVRRYQIDTNEHMNNAQYVKLAMEVLEDIPVREVRVEYKKSAVYNDIVYTKIAKETNRTVVTLCDAEDNTYAVVELIGEV